VVRLKQYKHLKEEDIPYKYRDHAWFTCFAPAENPEIAVSVLVEHGLHGGSGAAPIARAVLEKYFADRLQDPEEVTTVILPGRLLADSVQRSQISDISNQLKVSRLQREKQPET